MDDKRIVDLYWSRSESAISETEKNMENIATLLLIISLQTTKKPKKV